LGTNGNWSTLGNWLGGVIPADNDNSIFSEKAQQNNADGLNNLTVQSDLTLSGNLTIQISKASSQEAVRHA
jgi:hypothetical protein